MMSTGADRTRRLLQAGRGEGAMFHDLTRPHALVAEDDPDMRKLVSLALRTEGFAVIEVQSGTHLLEWIGTLLLHSDIEVPLDLIVSDIRMPGATGLEALATLRECDGGIPVILMTAFGDPATHAEAHRLGAAAVFNKPFDLRHLRAEARSLIGG